MQWQHGDTKFGAWKTAVTDDGGAFYLPVRTDDDADDGGVDDDHADTSGTSSDDDEDDDDGSVDDCEWWEDHWFDETWCSPTKVSVPAPHNDNVDANEVDDGDGSVDSLDDDVRDIADNGVDGNVEDGRLVDGVIRNVHFDENNLFWQQFGRCVIASVIPLGPRTLAEVLLAATAVAISNSRVHAC